MGFPFPVKVHQLETRHTNKRKLYTAQRAAVWSSILRKLTILIGPPGTGKTDTLLEIINTLAYNFCRKVRQRMLVVSHSNRALDQLYEAVVEFYKIESARLHAPELWVPDMVRLGGAYNKTSRYDIVNADIVFMTCTGCATRRFSMKWEFDIVIAEEAAKITQPEALPFLYNPSRLTSRRPFAVVASYRGPHHQGKNLARRKLVSSFVAQKKPQQSSWTTKVELQKVFVTCTAGAILLLKICRQ